MSKLEVKLIVLSAVFGAMLIGSCATTAARGGDGVTCRYDAYNCGDFSSCGQANRVFRACSGDPHGLDGDGDGVPCESLCR